MVVQAFNCRNPHEALLPPVQVPSLSRVLSRTLFGMPNGTSGTLLGCSGGVNVGVLVLIRKASVANEHSNDMCLQ